MDKEVKNLLSRHPAKGISPELPASVRAQLMAEEEARQRKEAGAAYDKAMPSPQRYAAGGSVRGWGKARSGKGCKTY